jgi:hypothetical protein
MAGVVIGTPGRRNWVCSAKFLSLFYVSFSGCTPVGPACISLDIYKRGATGAPGKGIGIDAADDARSIDSALILSMSASRLLPLFFLRNRENTGIYTNGP